jgi:hypothetical protein
MYRTLFDGQYVIYPAGSPQTVQIVTTPGRIKIIILPTQSNPIQLVINGNVGYLNQGSPLSSGNWYEFEYATGGVDVISLNGTQQTIYLKVVAYD